MKKNYPIFDIAKFIFSCFVVAIHSELFPNFLYPWLRIAVPMFFIISSYLFFVKVNSADNYTDRKKLLKKQVIRLFKLYAFYFIFTGWLFFYQGNFFSDGIIIGIITILKLFVFRTLFPAGWYIMATIIGTVIVFFCSQKVSTGFSMAVGIASFIFVAVFSTYSFLIGDFVESFRKVAFCPEFSFLVSLGYISIGELISKKSLNPPRKEIHEKRKRFKRLYLLCGLVVLLIALYLEWTFLKHVTGIITEDVLLMLYPVCGCLFLLIYEIEIPNRNAYKQLRNTSTITYLSHFVILSVISYIFNRFLNINYSVIFFVITLISCWILSSIVLKLEKNKYFKWLKYSH